MIIFGYSFRSKNLPVQKFEAIFTFFFLFFPPPSPIAYTRVIYPRHLSIKSSILVMRLSSSSPIHRINRTRCTLSLLDSVFRFSFLSSRNLRARSLSLSPTALPSPLLLLPLGERDRAPPTNWKGEALREGRRENALHSINISVWIGKPLRRDRVESSRSGRERARERRLCDARFEYYCLLLHSRATTEESVRKASSRRWKRRKERKRERKKNGPLAMPIFIPSSIVERENDPSLPLLQFEARLRVGSSSS